jgi:RNA polymerase sigma-70 factor (ECF subfamily)
MPRSGPEPEFQRLPTNDSELVRRTQRNDAAALDELVDRHAPDLFALAISIVGNRPDAEDAVQETLVGAVKGLAAFESRSSVKTWLTKVLIRQIARGRRGRRTEPLEETEPADDHAGARPADSTSPATQVERRLDVQMMLQTLSIEHREVLVLRELQGMSYSEIADAMDVPRGTVESRLHRAREQLRQRFAGYE